MDWEIHPLRPPDFPWSWVLHPSTAGNLSRFPSTLEISLGSQEILGVGDGFPYPSLVLVEHGYILLSFTRRIGTPNTPKQRGQGRATKKNMIERRAPEPSVKVFAVMNMGRRLVIFCMFLFMFGLGLLAPLCGDLIGKLFRDNHPVPSCL